MHTTFHSRLPSARVLGLQLPALASALLLAGCALAFERGWTALHQMLAVRPTGHVEDGVLKGAQSDYPFSRAYMYEGPAATH